MNKYGTTLLLLAATSYVLANKSVVKIDPDADMGDYDLHVAQRGRVSVVTFKNKDGETETEVFTSEGYEVEKPAGKNVCYVTPLDQQADESSCWKKTPFSRNDLPQTILEFCKKRPLFAREPAPCNEGVGRHRRGCGWGCWGCGGGICCGYTWCF